MVHRYLLHILRRMLSYSWRLLRLPKFSFRFGRKSTPYQTITQTQDDPCIYYDCFEDIEDNDDDRYFGSYGTLDCHQALISDFVRTTAFRNAILQSRNQLNNKFVLEVGCGTGILSVFACQAGAAGVLAVEPSDSIKFAHGIIRGNQCSDKVVLVQRRIEDLEPPPPGKEYDALISEWMGYTLLSEWMLPSVINARDRFLKKGGLIFPDKCSIYIAMVKEPQFLTQRADYWRDLSKGMYRVKMNTLIKEEYAAVIGKMQVHNIDPSDIASDSYRLFSVNLNSIQLEDCEKFAADFRLIVVKSCKVYGFCLWFTSLFPSGVYMDTSPYEDSTHWKQTILFVPPFTVRQGTKVLGSILFRQHSQRKRRLAIDLMYALPGEKDGHEFVFEQEKY